MTKRRTMQVFERSLTLNRQRRTRDLEGLYQDLENLRQSLKDRHAMLESGWGEESPILNSFELHTYYDNYNFTVQQISLLKKEELVILGRIGQCREEILAVRQKEKQIRLLTAKVEQRRVRHLGRRSDEELLTLGISRTLLLGEANSFRVPVRIPSIRLSRRASRENRGHTRD